MHDPLSPFDLARDELSQARESGHVVELQEQTLAALDPGDAEAHAALYLELLEAPRAPGWSYDEPAGLEAILASLPDDPPDGPLGTPELEDKVLGGWLGRIAGCAGRLRAARELAADDPWPRPRLRARRRHRLRDPGPAPARGARQRPQARARRAGLALALPVSPALHGRAGDIPQPARRCARRAGRGHTEPVPGVDRRADPRGRLRMDESGPAAGRDRAGVPGRLTVTRRERRLRRAVGGRHRRLRVHREHGPGGVRPLVLLGAAALPEHFVGPLEDRTRSALFGFDNSRISALARRTVLVARG